MEGAGPSCDLQTRCTDDIEKLNIHQVAGKHHNLFHRKTEDYQHIDMTHPGNHHGQSTLGAEVLNTRVPNLCLVQTSDRK